MAAPAAVTLALALAASAAAAGGLAVHARLAPDGRALAGVLAGTYFNPAPWPAHGLRIWRYPLALAEPPAASSASAQETAWEYPAGFQPAGMEIVRARIGPVGGPLRDVALAVDPHESAALLLPLAAPLAAGSAVAVEIEFEVAVPERAGLFGLRREVLTLAGGWAPGLAPVPEEGREDPQGWSRAAAGFHAELALPAGWRAPVWEGRAPEVSESNDTILLGQGAPTLFIGEESIDEESTAPAASNDQDPSGGPRAPPGPSATLWAVRGSPTCLTAPRGDRICWLRAPGPLFGGRPSPGHPWTRSSDPRPAHERIAADRARRALDAIAAAAALYQRATARAPPPLRAFVTPLKTEIALAADRALVLSDRAFALPPAELAMRYHGHEVQRAALAAWIRADFLAPRHGCARLPPSLLAWAPDAAAESLMTGAATPQSVDSALAWFDFLPGIDAFLRSPSGPLAHVYLRRSDPRPAGRADPLIWPHQNPRGRLVTAKLAALYGAPAVQAAHASWLACAKSLPDALDALGPEAGPLISTWSQSPAPALRYALGELRSLGNEHSLVLSRAGPPVPDPVTVRFLDEDGGATDVRLLVQDARTEIHIVTRAPLKLVDLDPERRLVEDVPPGEDPRLSHRDPPGWQVVVTSFLPAYLASQGQFQLYTDLLVQPRGNRRDRFLAAADLGPAALTAAMGYSRSFGPAAHAGRLAGAATLSAGGGLLRAGFADRPEAVAARAGWFAFGAAYDDSPNTAMPTFARVFSASIKGGMAQPDIGPARFYGVAGVRAVASLATGPMSALLLKARVSSALGDAPLQEWPALGGLAALRGFDEGEVPARQRWLAGAEVRATVVDDLGLDLASLAWLRGVQGLVFADLGGARSIVGLPSGDHRLFGDLGFGARLVLEYFGAQQGLLSVEAGIPFGRLARDRGKSPLSLYIRLLTPSSGM